MSEASSPAGLIAIMGPTGSGKSSFANLILGRDAAGVSGGLESMTSEVGQYSYRHPSGVDVDIVDTPGFDDYRAEGSKSDLQVLQMIAKFLKDKHAANQKFSGVIFMHNINTPKVDWQTQRRNMTLFKKLCGTDSIQNVVVVTTFWDELSDISVGVQREQQLQSDEGLLKELHTGGAKFARFGHFKPGKLPHDPQFLTPQQVVDYLLGLRPVFVEMQKEMADGKSVADTTAGSSLLEELEQHKREVHELLRLMKQEIDFIKTADDASRSHREELKQEAQRMQEQLRCWEKDGTEMRMKIADWDRYREQVVTKEQLDGLVSRHQNDVDSLQSEITGLREANIELRQMDQKRIHELNETLSRVRKDRDRLDEECLRLRTGSEDTLRDRVQSITSSLTSAHDKERARLQASLLAREEELKQAREALSLCRRELSEANELRRNGGRELKEAGAAIMLSQEEVATWKKAYEQLAFDCQLIKAERDEALRDREVAAAKAAKVAVEELKARYNPDFQKACASARSEAEARRLEQQEFRRSLKQRDDTIAELMEDLAKLRSKAHHRVWEIRLSRPVRRE